LRRIEQLRPTAVVMGNSIGYVIGPGRIGGYSQLTLQQWRDGARSTLRSLNSAGIRTIVVADVPRASFDIPNCLSRAALHGWSADACGLGPESLDHAVMNADLDATRGLPLAAFLDMSDLIFGRSSGAPVINGLVVYADSNHMTASFAKTLGPALEKRIDAIIAPSLRERVSSDEQSSFWAVPNEQQESTRRFSPN
jgi:hypothetical protein